MARTKINYPDVGYTPNNLRALIKSSGLTQAEFAKRHNIPLRTLGGYLADVNSRSHRTMSHKLWLSLINND